MQGDLDFRDMTLGQDHAKCFSYGQQSREVPAISNLTSWLPIWPYMQCDLTFKTIGQTDRRTHRQTPDKVIPMCRYTQATQKWMHSDLDFRDMTLGQDHAKCFSYGQQSREVPAISNLTSWYQFGHICSVIWPLRHVLGSRSRSWHFLGSWPTSDRIFSFSDLIWNSISSYNFRTSSSCAVVLLQINDIKSDAGRKNIAWYGHEGTIIKAVSFLRNIHQRSQI